MSEHIAQFTKRRTFAIISHPDAGKTTLTEKLLLFGGAIQLAGTVKGRKASRHATSDWMELEKQRGISVTTSVMQFPYHSHIMNLLDTPGHADFSEDTYRTLTAVDSALMVIDAAKGIESQTRKLFEVCRLRDIPIMTFINKMDREARDPFELIDEIADQLQLECAPMCWPAGSGLNFHGVFDFTANSFLRFGERGSPASGLDSLPAELRAKLDEDIPLVRHATHPFDLSVYREGHMTPVYFGAALKGFGVRDLLQALARVGPLPPRHEAEAVGHRKTAERAQSDSVLCPGA